MEASSPEEAEEKALDEAGNHIFTEHHSEYEAQGVSQDRTSPTLPM